jgi:hypothetical protein
LSYLKGELPLCQARNEYRTSFNTRCRHNEQRVTLVGIRTGNRVGAITRKLDNERLSAEVLRTEWGVSNYPSFPEDLSCWASNDTVLVRRSPVELRLFARGAVDIAILNRCDQLLHFYP